MDIGLTPEQTSRLLNRLLRIEGQARGLRQMIEEGRSCEEVFVQLSATKAALDRVGILLISETMRSCLHADEAEDSNEAIQRALETFLRYATAVRPEADAEGDRLR